MTPVITEEMKKGIAFKNKVSSSVVLKYFSTKNIMGAYNKDKSILIKLSYHSPANI